MRGGTTNGLREVSDADRRWDLSMSDTTDAGSTPAKKTTRKTAASASAAAPAKKAAAKKTAAKKTAAEKPATAAKTVKAAKTAKASTPAPSAGRGKSAAAEKPATTGTTPAAADEATPKTSGRRTAPVPIFVAPDVEAPAAARTRTRKAAAPAVAAEPAAEAGEPGESAESRRRRRRRGGRGRRREGGALETTETGAEDEAEESGGEDAGEGTGTTRRRRRRRRAGESGAPEDEPNTVVRVREPRSRTRESDEITAVRGSTRLEAKRQRRREGREAGRRRTILTEAEFLARRESVDRVMVVRERPDRTQIAVLEDNILVEHYVTRAGSHSLIGNVYLGKVQNVLPSMEAAFIDIGRGRNAVLYAGEVNWDALGVGPNEPKRIENVLKSGDSVLVQVTKDPLGHKGARLTSQISLPGRFLVYVPHGTLTGISRKLPENERNRLKTVLRSVLPEDAGVIVRTAAEGAAEDELARDVSRLAAQWDDIKAKSETAKAPALLYAEPDLAIKVVRDIFNEDVKSLVVAGTDVWDTLDNYVRFVAPDLADRLTKWTGTGDVFAEYRVDEQLTKALDRKVYLPSGGSLVIDRTEAMTVIDVNTGKFTGTGTGNLEETVTRNNLEAAEEIVRQLRLRDVGGIIVIDFIDMVLESNRDLVVRRLLECLGRDRTKHQVAEVTSLGLVQMTRKRIGQGLLEVFSDTCEHCSGRGIKVSTDLTPKAERAERHEHREHREHRHHKDEEATESPRATASKSSRATAPEAEGSGRRRSRGKASASAAASDSAPAPEPAEPTQSEAATQPADAASSRAGGEGASRGRGRRRASRPAGAPSAG